MPRFKPVVFSIVCPILLLTDHDLRVCPPHLPVFTTATTSTSTWCFTAAIKGSNHHQLATLQHQQHITTTHPRPPQYQYTTTRSTMDSKTFASRLRELIKVSLN